MNELFRALPKLIEVFEDTPEVREAVVFAVWRKIAGESLRGHTVPFRLFGQHLIVAVADNMWKRHLEMLSGQMIYKLNSALEREAVTFIEFRIDEETLRREHVRRPQTTGEDDESEERALDLVTPKLRHSADAIKDDHLRYQFLLAAGSCLARKEKMKKNPK
ncbi:MAG: DUF721 domain-containing protein [Pyrinomonadaceae bacterium]